MQTAADPIVSEATTSTDPPETTGDGATPPATPSHAQITSGRAPRWFYAFLPNKVGIGSTIALSGIYVTEVLGGNVAQVGVISSFTSAASVPAATGWGWLSDRYGTRKLYLILGFLGFGIPTLLTGFTHSVPQFLLLSVLVGALSIAGTPVSSTLVMDTTPKYDWDITFGRFNQVSGWGMVAGRVVGLLWISYAVALMGNGLAQRGLWILGGTLSIASVVWAWYTVPEPRMPKPRPARKPVPELTRYTGYALIERVRFLPSSLYYLPKWDMAGRVRNLFARMRTGVSHLPDHMHLSSEHGAQLVREPLMLYYYASFFLFLVGTTAYTPFAVWQVDELNNSTTAVFLVGLMNSVAAAFSYRWVGQLIRYVGSLRVQMATVSLRIVVFGGFGVMSALGLQGLPSIIVLIVLQAISGLGWAGIAVAGNSTVAHLAPKGSEGTAMGTYASFISVGSIIGAFISGYMVLWFGYAAVFFLSALGVALTVAMLWWVRRTAGHLPDAQL